MKKLTKVLASITLSASLLFTTVSGASAATYTVKSNDTLSGIARQYGTTYTEIMKLNGLTSTKIKVGQKLQVNGSTAASSSTQLVNIAKNYLGVPYVFGGTSTSGFDCSGFVYYVFKNAGKSVSRTSAAGYYYMAKKVSTPKVGDLVFFSNTYKAGISHVGIYIGNGKMINASGKSVNIASIQSGYWKSHLTSYGRI